MENRAKFAIPTGLPNRTIVPIWAIRTNALAEDVLRYWPHLLIWENQYESVIMGTLGELSHIGVFLAECGYQVIPPYQREVTA